MPKVVENFRIRRWIGILGVAMGLQGCSLGYLLRQGSIQASLFLKQEPLDRAIARLPEDQADLLRYARRVKDYAIREIGLKETRSYESYVEMPEDVLSYVVSAAPRDRLEPYLWEFPIVGKVPYKGFFDKAEAERERARLEEAGFDVHLRGVAAFSLLGYLADPLYSTMLRYSRAGLANLIIHELTHATVFLPGNPTFNEGFATYVGNTGARAFLEASFGPDSTELRSAIDQAHDDKLFSDFTAHTVARLRVYYARIDLDSAAKIAGREALFEEARREFGALGLRRPDQRAFSTARLNNAYFLIFDTYERDLSTFARARPRFGSLKEMVAFFRDRVAKQEDPEAYLATWESGDLIP